MGLVSGDWRASMPDAEAELREQFRLVKLWTSNVADALYIQPIQALGLRPDGVITLQHALKRAIERVFQVESNEIGVVTVGDPEAPNILLFEAAEGSLGILSQFVENIDVFQRVVAEAATLCRFNDPDYKDPASYDDLLSYYNQRDHKVIDRHLIQDALQTLLADRTAIIIAHRLSTVAIADRVLVMEHGRIIEDDTPAALISGTGKFAQLHAAWRESLV